MKTTDKKKITGIILATIWIIAWEMLRNELLFKSLWVDHFDSLGLDFQTLPINGILWTIWSAIVAYVLYELMAVLHFKKALVFTWLLAFPAMWIVVYNLQTLPLKLLWAAIPLSIVEVYVAGLIIKKITFNK